MESDDMRIFVSRSKKHFYPRSPHGERHLLLYKNARCDIFLSTLSAWRATYYLVSYGAGCRISIHALRMESDMQWAIETLGLNDISIHALRMESDFISPSKETA